MNEEEKRFFKNRNTFVNELMYKIKAKENNKKIIKQKFKKSIIGFNKRATIIIIILTFLGVAIASIFGYLTYISE